MPARPLPRAVVRSFIEAHASPTDRGFGLGSGGLRDFPMPHRPTLAPTRTSRSPGSSPRRFVSGWSGSRVTGSLGRRQAPSQGAARRACSGLAAATQPGRPEFGPGPARRPTHPISPAPTTRHDLASVQRTRGRIAWVGAWGDCFLLSTYFPTSPVVTPAKAGVQSEVFPRAVEVEVSQDGFRPAPE